MLPSSILILLLKLYGSYAVFLAFMLQSSMTLILGVGAFIVAACLRVRSCQVANQWPVMGRLHDKRHRVLWKEGRHYQ